MTGRSLRCPRRRPGIAHRRRGRRRPSTRSRRSQLPDGNIPWIPGGHTDPWNLVEAAMALDVGGRHAEAERAYEWLAEHAAPRRRLARLLRRRRGRGGQARHQRHRATSPPACGTTTSSPATAASSRRMWPVVERAIDFVARPPDADRARSLWARHADGTPRTARCSPARRASATACAARSRVAERLGHERPDWELSLGALAIVDRAPARRASSTRTAGRWTGTTRSSAACCAASAAERALAARWDAFVVDGPRRALRVATGRGSPRPRRASS